MGYSNSSNKNIISEVKNIDDKIYAFVENKKIIMDQVVC